MYVTEADTHYAESQNANANMVHMNTCVSIDWTLSKY